VPDYTDVRDLHARQAAARGPSPEEFARHQAAQDLVVVRLETLLQATEWETYVAHVDTLRQRDEAQLTAIREQIEGGRLVGDDLARASHQAFGYRSRLEAFRDALAIPAAVLKQAGKEPPARPAEPRRPQPAPKKRRRR